MRLNISRSSAHLLAAHSPCKCPRCAQVKEQIQQRLRANNQKRKEAKETK